MKKSLLISVLLLLIINIVNAGETYKLDFSTSNSYVVGLNNGDRVEFKLKDSLSTLLIKKINPGSVDIATFTHIDDEDISSKVPLYTNLDSKKFLKLDIERDGEADLHIIYKESNRTAVSLILQLPVGSKKDLEVLSRSDFEKNNFMRNLFYLFVIILVLFGLIYLILRRKAKETEKVIENSDQNKPEKNL